MPIPVPRDMAPVEAPLQFTTPQFGAALAEVDTLVQAGRARSTFEVSGHGLAVAVLDTGLRTTHVDFAGRVPVQVNFTTDNGGRNDDATDGNGHGTNVSGIVAAGADHIGMAPDAHIIPVKVLENSGRGEFRAVDEALRWVLQNRETYRIGAVCMSLGDGGNYESDEDFEPEPLATRIHALHEARVVVAVAAGNDYHRHESRQGMSYPAILRETMSVGSVYDSDEGPFRYRGGAQAFGTGADRITPFSQRLHATIHAACRTDVFAPGAPVTSSGIENDRGESVQQGTSQAAPVTAGVILLMQELHLRLTGRLPEVAALVEWMRRSGAVIHDGDDESDNVRHTNLDFRRVDAYAALDAVRRALQKHLIDTGTPLR